MHVSFWEQDAMLDADHIVIGGGIIGLQTALELRSARPHDRIILLERGILPAGASTRNAGFACFGSLTEILADIAEMGAEQAVDIVARRWRGLQRLRARMGDAALHFESFGGSELLFSEQLPALEQLDRINELLHPVFGQKVFELDPARLKASAFGSKVLALVHTPLEGQIHSGRALRALASMAAQQGIEIHTGAKVTRLEESGAEVRVHVGGERKLVFRAARVAVCTNGLIKELLPDTDIVPGRGQVIVTAPIPDLPVRGTFHFDEGYYYFRNVGNRVLFGGARNVAYDEEETSEMQITETIQQALLSHLRETILPGRTVDIEHRWAGVMGFTKNSAPIVRHASSRVVIGFGCNGMGVAIGADIAAETASLLIES